MNFRLNLSKLFPHCCQIRSKQFKMIDRVPFIRACGSAKSTETSTDTSNDEGKKKQSSEQNYLYRSIRHRERNIKRLQAINADHEEVNAIKAEIKQLYKQLNKFSDSNRTNLQLKPAKGTHDYGPKEMAVRLKMLDSITTVFKRYGAVSIDTPVFELREVLTGKYGEDSKLIYNLDDEGGELLSLRYDLTVPFARYLAMNKIRRMKRYQIGKVYRRDDPVTYKVRYREFIQCDFDIAGQYDTMVPEIECVSIAYDVLDALNLNKFRIRINHRGLVDGLFEACGIDSSQFKTISSAIDKLDKDSWATVRKEMTEKKGLGSTEADLLGRYIQLNGGKELVDVLLYDKFLTSSNSAKKALEDIKLFLDYCRISGIEDKLSFDLSLVRGLDYYTGLIYEVVLDAQNEEKPIGSVAGGGRYDSVVGMMDAKKNDVPCIGISFGFERLFSVIQAKIARENTEVRTVATDVFVASPQKGFLEERMKICRELRNNKINTEQSFKLNPKLLGELHYCESRKIPYAVIIGDNELQKGVVKIRKISTREETEVARDDMTEELKKKLLHLHEE